MPKLVLLCVLFAATGCASDADDGSGGGLSRGCGTLDGPDVPAEVCALKDSKELLRCQREPFTYSRQRDGLLLRIECHVVGKLPARGAEYNRWVSERADVSIVKFLAEGWSLWPMAECDLNFVVSSLSRVQQTLSDNMRVDASMWSHDNTATVGVLPPLASDSVVFQPDDCTYDAPTQM